MTQPPPAPGTLKVITANLEYGGISLATGDDSAARRTIAVLADAAPDIVLLQEVHTPDPVNVRRHLRRIAGELGMQPVAGPSVALRAATGLHVALLLGPRITIRDEWPLPPGPAVPYVRAEVTIPGIPAPVQVHSAHLAARSAQRRLEAAEILASYAADTIAGGGHVLAGGDLNCVPVAGSAGLDLSSWEPRLLAQRCARAADGTWEPDLRVGRILHASGLSDLAAVAAAATGDEAPLAPTGAGGARVDQIHASPALAGCAASCTALEIGSDHQAVCITLDLARLPAAA